VDLRAVSSRPITPSLTRLPSAVSSILSSVTLERLLNSASVGLTFTLQGQTRPRTFLLFCFITRLLQVLVVLLFSVSVVRTREMKQK